MYIGSSQRVKQLDKRMAEANDVPLEKWDPTLDALLDRLLEKAQYLGIKTVAELDANLKELGETALRLSYYSRAHERMHAGFCLDRMFDVKAAQSGREGVINMYTSAKLESGGERWAEGVWQAYEQIKTYGIGAAGTSK